MKLKHLYLASAVLGICYTWYYNIQWFGAVENPTISKFITDAQANFAGKSLGADLSVVILAFFVFMISESIRLKIKFWWILIPLTFIIAIAFTFPLFLYMREVRTEKVKDRCTENV